MYEAPAVWPPDFLYWSLLWLSGCIAFTLAVLVSFLHRNDRKPDPLPHFGPIIRTRVPRGREER